MRDRVWRAALLGAAAIAACPAAAHAADAAPADKADVGEVVVLGEKAVTVATSATKSDTPLIETPQSLTVIDGAEISNLGLQNLNQALRYVAGVTPETRGASAEVYDQFKLRGFDAPIYLDGLRLFASGSGYAAPQVDVSRLDRIEVLKGPASALYGQSTPGGLVDESSKLPLDMPFYGAVAGSYGTYDLYRFDADVGGKASPLVAWRLYGSVNGAHDQQEFGKRRRQTISGAVKVGNDATSLTLLANYSHDPLNGDYGVFPALGTLIPNPAGKISTHFYDGEPGDFFRRNQASATYIFKHDFGNGWAFRASGRYQWVKSALGIIYTSGSPVDGSDPAPTLYNRASYATQEHLNAWTFDNQLTGKFDTGPLHHSLLAGFDAQVSHSYELYAFGSATPIDAFNPVYGTMPTPQTPADVPDAFSGEIVSRLQQLGAYLQDQVSVGDLRVTLSGRYDWATTGVGAAAQDDGKFTYRLAALYLTPIGLAPYVSYSTSFQPQATLLSDNTLAKPSIGKGFEAGVKYQVPGTTILLTGAYFDIDQSNVVVFNPLTFAATQVGKARARGVELEASGSLPYGFNMRVAFSRQSVKDVGDPAKGVVSFATVGRGGISANLEWAPRSGPAEGLAIGGGVRRVDSTKADHYFADPPSAPDYNSPAYTVFDALVRYDLGRFSSSMKGVTVGLNVTNLFDKTYLTSCFANYGWCWYGDRRTVQGTIGYRW